MKTGPTRRCPCRGPESRLRVEAHRCDKQAFTEPQKCLHEAAETMVELKLPRFHPQGDDSKRGSSTCLHLGLLLVAAKQRRENRALDIQYVVYGILVPGTPGPRARGSREWRLLFRCRASAVTGHGGGSPARDQIAQWRAAKMRLFYIVLGNTVVFAWRCE